MSTFHDDPEFRALYAGVCAAPTDRTARLVLADWLQERDAPAAQAWAEFVRAQEEYAGIGGPRFVIEVGNLAPYGGPGYYRAVVDSAAASQLTPGARVDVHLFDPRRKRTVPQVLGHGLRVVRFENDDGHTGDVTLAQDEFSVPYPADRRRVLHETADRLLRDHWRTFAAPLLVAFPPDRIWRLETTVPTIPEMLPVLSGYDPVRPGRGFIRFRFEGGLPAVLDIGWNSWLRWGAALVRAAPLRGVHLNPVPVLHTNPDAANRRTLCRLSGARASVAISDARFVHPGGAALGREVVLELLRKDWPTVETWEYDQIILAAESPLSGADD